MNIWAMRNKLKQVTVGGQPHQPMQPQQVQQPRPIEAAKPLPQPALAPVPQQDDDVVITHIGLNSLFELNESELRKFSPSCSFSKLKNPQPPTAQSVTETLRPSVGLNDLLTMDADQVDRLYS